jgi:vacuolar iron transporter family protein
MSRLHLERHRSHRAGWLRASVLGANDGLVSVASLMVGIASSGASSATLLLTGVAGLVAGAMSMAAGEYVSVKSQSDTENADMARERKELTEEPDLELAELAGIYRMRGLDAELAQKVAEQLTAKDAFSAHLRDELGITETLRARPLQAALASALAFAFGAIIPLIAAWLSPATYASLSIGIATVISLAALGSTAAILGGAPVLKGALRVLFWGVAAMILTALIGRLFGASV